MKLFSFLKSKAFLIQIGIAIVVFFVIVFGISKWLDITTNHDQKIQVPDISKLSVEDSKVVLEEVKLRIEVLDSINYNPNFPPLSVIEQSPEAGDFVKENRRVYVKINRPTYAKVTIPDVLGKPKRNAEMIIKATGFKVGGNPVYVKDIAKDVVRGLLYKGKEIKPGDKLPRNSVIDLKLGDGGGN